MNILQTPVKNIFQITFSLLALVGKSFLNKPFLPVSDEFTSHRHSLSQSVLGESYEPEFSEISLATLYTEFLVCHL